jgi:hypothetical protein
MADAEKERRDSGATTLSDASSATAGTASEAPKAQPSPEDVAAADTLKDEGNKAFAGATEAQDGGAGSWLASPCGRSHLRVPRRGLPGCRPHSRALQRASTCRPSTPTRAPSAVRRRRRCSVSGSRGRSRGRWRSRERHFCAHGGLCQLGHAARRCSTSGQLAYLVLGAPPARRAPDAGAAQSHRRRRMHGARTSPLTPWACSQPRVRAAQGGELRKRHRGRGRGAQAGRRVRQGALPPRQRAPGAGPAQGRAPRLSRGRQAEAVRQGRARQAGRVREGHPAQGVRGGAQARRPATDGCGAAAARQQQHG